MIENTDSFLTLQLFRQCSYYLSRHMSKEANLVLLPYNYLINVGMMQAFDLQLNGAIVIFDEAHNLVGFFFI